MRRLARSCLAAALALTSGFAVAETYPTRPITLVVPYAPGGSSDIVGRLFAQGLSARLGQTVVVDNIAGAGGTIGAQRAAQAEADGYTLLVGAGSELFIFGHLNPAPGYDALTDFEPIGMLGVGPMVVVARPDLPATTFAEAMDLAAEVGGGLTYGSAGIGTFMHLVGAAIDHHAGVDVTHVPYRGAGPLMVDVIASQIDLGVSSLAAALPFIEAGQARALAVTSGASTPLAPGIPTLAEQAGMDGFELELWIGLFARAGTPDNVLSVIREATADILDDDAFVFRVREQALLPRPDLTGASLTDFLQTQDEAYGTIIAQAGMSSN